jgi:hypothetical protein
MISLRYSFLSLLFVASCGMAQRPFVIPMNPSKSAHQLGPGKALAIIERCWTGTMGYQSMEVKVSQEGFVVTRDVPYCGHRAAVGMLGWPATYCSPEIKPGRNVVAWNAVRAVRLYQISTWDYVQIMFPTGEVLEISTLTCHGTEYTTQDLVDALSVFIAERLPAKVWHGIL